MGASFSSDPHPNRNPYYHNRPRHHPPPPPYNPTASPPPAPPSTTNYGYAPPVPPPRLPQPTTLYATSTSPYAPPTSPFAPPANPYNYQYPPHIPPNYNYPGWQNSFTYANPMMGHPNFSYSYGNHGSGWPPVVNAAPPPAYVEHQNAKVVKNAVNVHKDSIKLEVDENHPDQLLVSFVFDARYDGSVTIHYFVKEEKESQKFIPAFPEAPSPVKIPFQKGAGAGERFRQPSGTGVDLRRYDREALRKPSDDGVSPLVILAEVTSQAEDGEGEESSSETSQRAQITHAVIEREGDDSFQVNVLKQIVSIDGVHYEVRELYGIGSSSARGFNDDEPGKECVICMTQPKDTAVMPCRHLCMCSDCAKELRLQTNKCPICRQPITELIEIKISNNGDE